MFVHGHPRALGWVKGHYRAPNSPADEQLGLDLELEPAAPEIPRPRSETDPEADPPAGPDVAEDQPARPRSRGSDSASTQSRVTTAISES